MIVFNLTDVNRTAVPNGPKTLAIWKHRTAIPGGFVRVPGSAKLDPRLQELERKGAIAFEQLPTDYTCSKRAEFVPAPEELQPFVVKRMPYLEAVYEDPEPAVVVLNKATSSGKSEMPPPEMAEDTIEEAADEEEVPDREETIEWLCTQKKGALIKKLEDAEIDHEPKMKKADLAGLLYDARYGGE